MRGLHRFVDPVDGHAYLYQQSFLDDAQRTFACFDQPDLKAAITLTVEAPPDWTVVGNARGRRTGSRWTFAPTERISTYLFCVAAGPWHSAARGQHDGIELGLHCRQSLAPHLDADADELFEISRQSLDFQQERFGRRYPVRRQLRPAVRPGVQRRRDGEPGRGHLPRPVPVPLPASRMTSDASGRWSSRTRWRTCGSATWSRCAGGDDLWLNESFAELMGLPHRRPRYPIRRHLGRFQHQSQGLGVSRGPAAEHPPRPGRTSPTTAALC